MARGAAKRATTEAEPSETLQTATVAALLAVTPSAVRQLTRRGEQADRLPVQVRSQGGRQANQYDAAAVGLWLKQRAAAEALQAAGAAPGDRFDIEHERARTERYRANMAEMDLAVRRAELLPIETFVSAHVQFGIALRTRLVALKGQIKRVQPQLSAAALHVLEQVIADSLDELARLRFDEHGNVEATGELTDLHADDPALPPPPAPEPDPQRQLI